jgi:hypothetical protein
MQLLSLKQELIEKLVSIEGKKSRMLKASITNAEWVKIKTEKEHNLAKMKKYARFSVILASTCFAITAAITLVKIFSETIGPDLNKGALFLFLTVSNMFTAFAQKIRIEKLEKQILILDILQKLETSN